MKQTWCCWKLYRQEMNTINQMRFDAEKPLTDDECEQIAEKFQDLLADETAYVWEEMLEEAIRHAWNRNESGY